MGAVNRITKYWQDNADFSERAPIDFAGNEIFAEATKQLAALLAAFPNYTNLVEIGSGNGSYLDYLSRKFQFEKVIGSDLRGPRLKKAKKDFPELKFRGGDALAIIKKYNQPNTVFLAMNVLDNLEPADIEKLFARLKIPQTALVFCSGGLALDRTERFHKRSRPFNPTEAADAHIHAYSYNYIDLIRAAKLTCHSSLMRYEGDSEGRSVFVVTCYRSGKNS